MYTAVESRQLEPRYNLKTFATRTTHNMTYHNIIFLPLELLHLSGTQDTTRKITSRVYCYPV